MLHSISCPPGRFGTGEVADLFLGRLDCSRHPAYREIRGKKLSAHFFIDRRGAVTQFVETDRVAYHAGRSRWEGEEECNDFSIGIELEGDDRRPFTTRQYRTLALLCRDLMRLYPAVTPGRVVGHSDIAPERKTDPGPHFDWQIFRRLLASFLGRSTGTRRRGES